MWHPYPIAWYTKQMDSITRRQINRVISELKAAPEEARREAEERGDPFEVRAYMAGYFEKLIEEKARQLESIVFLAGEQERRDEEAEAALLRHGEGIESIREQVRRGPGL